ncbi:MAG: ligase-associated DNA damage response endonuclease PdeM [Aquabacterium sp.]
MSPLTDVSMQAPPVPSDADHVLTWPQQGAALPLSLWLMPERAVYWPQQGVLFVADVHVGKAAVFRARGLPVPQGTTTATLQRLSHAVTRTRARTLVVLGDFLHARESLAPATLAALRAWRSAHAELTCIIVQGNHDRHAGAPPPDLRMAVHPGAWRAGALVGVHDANEVDEADEAAPFSAADATPMLQLAGHVHPVVTLRDRLDHLRLPCFVLQDRTLTLPAFGDFTGGFEETRPDARVFVAAHRVVAL